jgi:hypothetical protein
MRSLSHFPFEKCVSLFGLLADQGFDNSDEKRNANISN